MKKILAKIKKISNSPGVYIFRDRAGVVLYVGKATSLRDRVGSYFGKKQDKLRPIEKMIGKVAKIEVKETDSVLEAFILEQNLIKKLQPKYNVDGKDDKSFSWVALTAEDFPRFIILRKTEIEKFFAKSKIRAKKFYGPYTSRKKIEIVLKILRKIFPFHSLKEKTEKECLDFQIGLCPGPYAGIISRKDYGKNIRGIRLILDGRKKSLLREMEKEMEKYSEKFEYEKAAKIRNQILALRHIRDVALISEEKDQFDFRVEKNKKNIRWEAYDISNISGNDCVGSLVVFDNSSGKMEANKKEYRKFKIRTVKGTDDVGAMKEILQRRFARDWPRPDLIFLDGGLGHLNMARRVLQSCQIDIPIVAVAKGPERKKADLYFFGKPPKIPEKIIRSIRDEAHRFALSYHRKLRRKNMKNKLLTGI